MARAGGVKVEYVEVPKVAQACVLVSFDAPGNAFMLRKFLAGEPAFEVDKVHESAIMASLFTIIKNVMSDPMKFKASAVKCNYCKGQLVISISCAPTKSAVRTCAVNACKLLSPAKYFNTYKELVKTADVKPSRKAFADTCRKLNANIAKGVFITIVGKTIKNAPEVMADISTRCTKVIAPAPVKDYSDPIKPHGLEAVEINKTVLSPSNGVVAVCLAAYITGVAKLDAGIVGDVVLTSATPARLAKLADAGKVAKWLSRKKLDRPGVKQLYACHIPSVNAKDIASGMDSDPTTAIVRALS